jgi:hypothetical protein
MMNVRWHRTHRMPHNPTAAQRLKWHLAHAKACACRRLTKASLEKLRAKARQ